MEEQETLQHFQLLPTKPSSNLATLTRVAIKVLCHHTGPASAETSLGKPSRSTADGTPHVSMRGAHDSWEVTYTATLEAKDPTAIWALRHFRTLPSD